MRDDQGTGYPTGRDIRGHKSPGEEKVEEERKSSPLHITHEPEWGDSEETPQDKQTKKSA